MYWAINWWWKFVGCLLKRFSGWCSVIVFYYSDFPHRKRIFTETSIFTIKHIRTTIRRSVPLNHRDQLRLTNNRGHRAVLQLNSVERLIKRSDRVKSCLPFKQFELVMGKYILTMYEPIWVEYTYKVSKFFEKKVKPTFLTKIV